MTEEFLHYIWKHALYDSSSLKTENEEEVTVLRHGDQNYDSGPDFLNARLRIGDTTWAGNVEIHIKSSDWLKHRHQHNKAYNNVILQAVYHYDTKISLQNGNQVPTVELKFENHLYENYQNLVNSSNGIPCQDQLNAFDSLKMSHILTMLTVERLREKSAEIAHTLNLTKNDWSETFYIHLAKNFGFKINAVPFEMLARSLPLKYIEKHKDNLLQIEALLFGQAGFLNDKYDDAYYNSILTEYRLLKSKFSLKPLDKHIWKFLRLRPCNFPTIRLAQFARLLHGSSFLFRKIIQAQDLRQLKNHFNISASEYWEKHYHFGKESESEIKKSLGLISFNNVVINTVVPVMFVYGEQNGKKNLREKAIDYLTELPAEDNHIIRNWSKTGFSPKNAFETQGLLQLRNNYCKRRKCLNCRIGKPIIINKGQK